MPHVLEIHGLPRPPLPPPPIPLRPHTLSIPPHTNAAPRVRDMPHVVEIHGLTRATTTSDLEAFLLDYFWDGTAPLIRWVDDAHALAVFPCKAAADVLLEAAQRQYGVRPYCAASAGAHDHPVEGERRSLTFPGRTLYCFNTFPLKTPCSTYLRTCSTLKDAR